jgi:hypothetical protein
MLKSGAIIAPAELIEYIGLGRTVSPARLGLRLTSQPPAWAAAAVAALREIPWLSLASIQAGADVLLHIGDEPAEGPCQPAGRLATWSLLPRGRSFAQQMAAGQTVFDLELYGHRDRWENGVPLRIFQPGIWQTMFLDRAMTSLSHASTLLLLRALFDLAAGCGPSGSGQEIPLRRPRGVALVDHARIALPRLGAVIAGNTIRRGRRKEWFSAWRYRDREAAGLPDPLQPPFQVVEGRPGMGYADPFPVSWNGRDFLFIEEILPDDRGRLVVTEVVEGRLTPNPPAVVLDKPYHLSYPCVFQDLGEYWMIPESADATTVDLYRAVDFPWRWEHEQTLARGVRLVDTTPIQRDGVWYFFNSTQWTSEGRLFLADSLRGKWTEHPCSPLSTDQRRERSAGHLFTANGRLYRPVQDCSTGYGMAVRLMEILQLTPQSFEEREVAVITNAWHRQAVRTHTWNSGGRLECIDGGRWR